MVYQLANGTKVEGSLEQIVKVVSALGEKLDASQITGGVPRGYYLSESRGLVKIKEMSTFHIQRALLKCTKEYYTDLGKKLDPLKNFLKSFTGLSENPVIIDLYTELETRNRIA